MTLAPAAETILTRIHKHGFWRVVIRPAEAFNQDLIPTLLECKEILEVSTVSLRGWDYPHTSDLKIDFGTDWIQGSYDGTVNPLPLPHIELWRFYQSGQFVHHFSCREDWGDWSWPSLPEKSGSPVLSIWDCLFTLTEIFLFMQRLERRDVLPSGAQLSVKLVGMAGRRLINPSTEHAPSKVWGESTLNEICYSPNAFSSIDVLASADRLAIEAAEWVFERFGCRVPRSLLLAEQQRLLQRNL